LAQLSAHAPGGLHLKNMNIKIRPYRTGDADALFEAARESIEEVFPWLSWCHPEYMISEAHEWVATQVELFAKGAQYEFVVVSEAQDYLGACGLNHLDSINRSANLGYWVRTSAAGQGVASTAARSLVEWAFSNTEIERIEIVAAVTNKQSQAVAEKAGAFREGIARSRLFVHDRFHDAVIYSIIKSGGAAT
jgi:ribosomal-protein-serine acetyltransferase